ncbi:MAG: UDP-glucuronic acid decarboxylase family protein [Candidatus Firestonebacteria bacterium]|mgnify:CR=1 FL=1
MKRAVVAGGAGFIGSHLCEYLLSKDISVVCIDNLLTGKIENIEHLIKKSKHFKFVEHDISEPIKITGKIDYILDFASPASPVDYLKFPIETLKVGSIGVYNTLNLTKDKNAVFIIASTSEVYGDPLVHPQNEAYWGNVNPIGIRSVYDEAKRFAEAITMAYYRVYKLDTKIVRIFNTFGPKMQLQDGRVVPNFIYQALKGESITVYGNGTQTRSFCYVSDLVDGIYKLLISNSHEPVNLGNPTEMTILEFAKAIKKLTNSKSEIVFKDLPQDDPKQRKPDISRAKKMLGWQPQITLEEGLKYTISWFQEKLKTKNANL